MEYITAFFKYMGECGLTKTLAGGFEITAATLDVVGYILFIAFILGYRKGGEKVAFFWPLSIVLEATAYALWKY